MKVILREGVENLGKGGEVVDVKPGYGRNFLLPRGLAVTANPKNVREVEHQKQIAQAKAEERRAMAVALEQEMRARVVEAEAEVPRAMAEAFRQAERLWYWAPL